VVLAAVAAFAGASVQSATGFGFALVLSPALFAAVEPREAVVTLLLLGVVLNLLVLSDTRTPLRPAARALAPLLLAALPGLAVGLVLLELLDKPVLQLAVGAAVICAALIQLRAGGRRSEERGEPSLGSACAAGLASGALTTSTSVSGPPIVLWLQARGVGPEELRASLALGFLALNAAGGALVLVAGGVGTLRAELVLPLLALVVLGHFAGARVFRRLDAALLRAAVTALVLVTGAASAIAGLAGL
jgi:uncharacterized protein